MHHTVRNRALRGLTGAALAAALLASPGTATGAAQPTSTPEPAEPTAATEPDARSHTVGLITGDRVTVREHSDGSREVDVELAPRDGYEATYEIVDEAGQLYVFPSDARTLVPDTLDRELFNVTKLVEYGYGVRHGLPVIVMPEPAKGRTTALRSLEAAPGVRTSSALTSLGAQAATVASGKRTFWSQATEPGRVVDLTGALADAGMIWLDEKFEVALDESVPQVGAPQAWDLGYDGTGTTVAVLDTGIDADHPDLAGKVIDARSFVRSDTPDDGYGHGTHVAAIIAGDGDASDGRYTGVAPGAQLLNGKVLDDSGSGLTSWIIDGMEWAASEADVVNMSLGSNRPSNGFDLLSRSLDELTATHDTLFVVAAGNLGAGRWTVASPGAASSALTVGAVDGDDELARFSSRGPRLVPELRHVIGGEFAIKPDIAAPGVGIVSARANGTTLGTPRGANYTQASGTSMATPHVAGAAAILLQQRPDLPAAELKAELVTHATPNESLTVFDQGGGRLDIPAALAPSVSAAPAPVDFGSFEYPYTDGEPVTKTVTYTNTRDAPVSLDLALDVTSPESGAADAATLRATPSQLDLGPGESAEVELRLDPSQGEYGTYGGYLVATDGAGTVANRVPVGYWLEPEKHTLTIEGIDRQGDPANGPLDSIDLNDVDDFNTFNMYDSFYERDGTITMEVPRGTYAILGRFQDPHPTYGEEISLVSEPEVAVTEDTTVTLDARTANRVSVEVEGRDTEPLPHSELLVGYQRESGSGQSLARSFDIDPGTPIYVGETEAPATGELTVFSRWMLRETGARKDSTLYDLTFVESGDVPADLSYDVDADELASVRNRYHSDVADQVVTSTRFTEIPGWEGVEIGSTHSFNVPTERTDYYLGDSDVAHRQRAYLNGSRGPTLFTEPTAYEAGQHETQSWFARPITPGLRPEEPAVREWNTLRAKVSPWVDPGGLAHEGDVAFSYYRDGELVSQGEADEDIALPMSDRPAEYRLELRSAFDRSWWQTATSASTAWTLQSAPPADGGPETLPLLQVAYDLDLDPSNTLRGRPVVGLRIDHQDGAETSAAIEGARLWTSYDGGQTWRQHTGRTTGDGRYAFDFDVRGDRQVSLKVEAWDSVGNRIEQQVVDAFRLPSRPSDPPPAGTTELVSVASDGTQANRGPSAPPAISANGRYVAFESIASNLVPGDPDVPGGVFVHDRRTGRTERVSFAADGSAATGYTPSISADGRHIAFASSEALVPDDTNDEIDVYVHDRSSGTTERVSVASDGSEGNDGASSAPPAISADGRYVAYSSYASNLVDGDTNDSRDVFVHDRQTGESERASVATDGSETARFRSSADPVLSADGRYVAFESSGDNLAPGDTNNSADIFVRDLQAGTIERVSVAGDGTEASGSSTSPSIDASGRYVAFASWASTLVPGDTNGTGDVFVHDRQTGETTRVSLGSDGGQGDGYSSSPAISPDGRYVGFPSGATTLVDGDTNDEWDTFVHDRRTGETRRVSVSAAGLEANGSSGSPPALSADGQAIAFVSRASNLVPDDTNLESDVFVRLTR